MATIGGESNNLPAFTPDSAKAILASVAPSSAEVPVGQVVPEAVIRAQVSTETLSSQTISIQRQVLQSEVRFLMAKDIATLKPHEKTLLNQVNTALGVDITKVDDVRLATVITNLLNSPDITVKQVMGKIADITARVQLARIQVGTDATYHVDPADKEQFVAREAQIASTGGFGDPKLPVPQQKPEMKGWWNAPRRAFHRLNDTFSVGKSDTRIGAMMKAVTKKEFWGQAYFEDSLQVYRDIRSQGQRTHARVTVDFPENALLTNNRTLEGNDDYVRWISQQRDIATAAGKALTPQDKDRIRTMAQERLAAIMEYATVHQGKSLDTPEDFHFIHLDPTNANTYEVWGPVRNPYNTRIEGLVRGESFPSNFGGMKPVMQLKYLTDVLERRAMEQEKEKLRQQGTGQRIETHLAEARSRFEQSKSAQRYAKEIAEQTDIIAKADAELQAIDQYKAAVGEVVRLEGEFTSAEAETNEAQTELTSREVYVGSTRKKVEDINREFKNLDTEKKTQESLVRTHEQTRNNLQARLASLQRAETPDPIQIEDVKKQLEEALNDLGKAQEKVHEIQAEIAPLQAGETLYQELSQSLREADNKKHRLEAEKKAAEKKKTAKTIQLSTAGIIETDIDDDAKTQAKKAEITGRKAQADAQKRAYESQEGKGDAGEAYRVARLEAVKGTFFDVSKYQDVLKRTEQGVVDIVIPVPNAAAATTLARTAHPAGPDILLRHTAEGGMNPAYLQMVYVLMGPEALKMTPEGAKLFQTATHIISPEEFYGELRKCAEWAGVQRVINQKVSRDPSYSGADLVIDSIHSDKFHKDPDIMNAMMGIMKPDLISDILDQAHVWAKDGYLTGPQTVYADEVARMGVAASELQAQRYEALEQGDVQQSQERIAGELTARVIDIRNLSVPQLKNKSAKLRLASAIQQELITRDIAIAAGLTNPVLYNLALRFDSQNLFPRSLNTLAKRITAVQILADELLKYPVAAEDLATLATTPTDTTPVQRQIETRMTMAQDLTTELTHLYFESKYDVNIGILHAALPLLDTATLLSIHEALKKVKTTGVRPPLESILPVGKDRYDRLEANIAVTLTDHDTFANGMADIIDPTGTHKADVVKAYKISLYHLESEMMRNQYVKDFDRMFAHLEPGPELALQIKSATGCEDEVSAILVKRIKEKRAFRASRATP